MKQYTLSMIIETADILDDTKGEFHADEIKDLIELNTYDQITVKTMEIKEETK